APVEIDNRLLVDGGIANNLPIDRARELCGDVIIAVNISTPPLQRKDLTSALAVALQLLNFLGKSTVDEQLKSMGPNDVLIEPDLGDISAASFTRSKDAIRIGEEATRKLADKLSRYSVAPEKYAEFRAKQVADKAVLGTVAEIRFEGLERTNPEVLRGLLKTKPDEPLSEETINADLRRIYGRGDFEGVSYSVIGDGGSRTMVVTPREKLWGPDYLRFGLGLATDFQGSDQFNVLLQYRKTWLNSLGGEWLTEAQIGHDTHLFSEWYQPLNDKGVWFASLYGVVGQTTRGIFNDSVGDPKQIADYLISSARAGADFGATLGTLGALRVGPQWTQVHARVDVGDPVLPSVTQLTAGGRVNLLIDQFDHAWFPASGYGMTLNYYGATTALGSVLNYQRLQATGSYVASWGENTINLFAAGGTDFNSDMPAYEAFALGGPLRLSAFRLNQFNGHEYAFGRAMYYRRILPLPDLLGSGVYVGASAEVGTIRDRFDRLPSPGTLYSGSVFLGANTFAGPAFLGVGFGTSNAFSMYLLLGAP
ncbi:MAG: BamA/TamA family outer membrane protein, partial [Betaproteobacteria bacterium]